MILLDSFFGSEENEVLFLKIGASVLDLWLLDPKYQSFGI